MLFSLTDPLCVYVCVLLSAPMVCFFFETFK